MATGELVDKRFVVIGALATTAKYSGVHHNPHGRYRTNLWQEEQAVCRQTVRVSLYKA